MIDPKKSGKPGTKTLEPPAKKPSEQVPAGDDSDINTGNDPEQDAKVSGGESKPNSRTENRPIEKDSGGDENGGCAC